MDIYSIIQSLVKRAIDIQLIDSEDEVYTKNQLMDMMGLRVIPEEVTTNLTLSIPDMLKQITDQAIKEKLIGKHQSDQDIFACKIMNVFIPLPSRVNEVFYHKYENDPHAATAYFYDLSQNSNYIQTKSIAKNISYVTETPYGDLDITINLTKPEKNPLQIASDREQKHVEKEYPKCLLCVENEGYVGRIGHPARSNHRMIRLELGGEPWLFQYSPYVYYNEHCVIISKEHRDMVINHLTFHRLLEFVEKFPHYFIGSNADLPIVGGSILSHDHYQGGCHEFAMAKAVDEITFDMDSFPEIDASTINWPLSVIRLRGSNREKIARAADVILGKWQGYSDKEADIHAFSDETRHNTITPIARWKNGRYELDLVLRNNRTSEDYPLGIFHPHDDVHHIKKENIGLIEVMGLAVLPARLKVELDELESYLLGSENLVQEYHLKWAEEIKEKYNLQICKESVKGILEKELGQKFLKALLDAGVFKRSEFGRQAFLRFIESLRLEKGNKDGSHSKVF
ncbi:UDP-glucose--hexose-1-phosphate uridylyltransferase [Pseudoneobacillus sp. C159]